MDPPFCCLLHQKNGLRTRLWPTHSTQANAIVILVSLISCSRVMPQIDWPFEIKNIPGQHVWIPPFVVLLYQENGLRTRLWPSYGWVSLISCSKVTPQINWP